MKTLQDLKQTLISGGYGAVFSALYGSDPQIIDAQKTRYLKAIDEFSSVFPGNDSASLFSAPGRTEVGGNHTDHQHGIVLAAAVNLDIIAVVSPNQSGVIRIQSEGFPMDTVDLSELDCSETEKGSSAALIRGVASRFHQLGYQIGGFDAYTTSSVLKGSGLSSSAAFENLVGTVLNYCYNNGQVSPVEVAKISQYAEVHYFGKASGLMDQMVSSVGGFVSIDFQNPEEPKIEKIDFDFADSGHALCIVDTKGSHANLTPDYVAIPTEMKEVAAFFGKTVLREVEQADFYRELPNLRKAVSDRAILRSIHFFRDNQTAWDEAEALRNQDFERFRNLIKASGNSSFKFLQNIYSNSNPAEQGVSLGLAVSESVLNGRGACRVHGGGFAGTIQAFVPLDLVEDYRLTMEHLFGEGACYVLSIRPVGGTEITER